MSCARLVVVFLLAGCPKKNAPEEPAPPPPADAAALVDAAPEPMQTPPEHAQILAAEYPQHCTRDEECIAVFEGNVCNPCRCAFNAIRVEAFTKYKTDLAAYWSCHKPENCASECRQKIGDAAKCESGTCLLPP